MMMTMMIMMMTMMMLVVMCCMCVCCSKIKNVRFPVRVSLCLIATTMYSSLIISHLYPVHSTYIRFILYATETHSAFIPAMPKLSTCKYSNDFQNQKLTVIRTVRVKKLKINLSRLIVQNDLIVNLHFSETMYNSTIKYLSFNNQDTIFIFLFFWSKYFYTSFFKILNNLTILFVLCYIYSNSFRVKCTF